MSTDAGALPLPTASWGRRAVALVVDWVACNLVVSLFVPVFGVENQAGQWWVLALFVTESTVLTATAGGSFGKMATRLRVVRTDGGAGPLPPLRALVRSVLVALVVPPLVYRPDRRGLHDLAAGSATVPLQAVAAGTPTGHGQQR